MRTKCSCSWKKVADDDAESGDDRADIHKILRMMAMTMMMLTKFVTNCVLINNTNILN